MPRLVPVVLLAGVLRTRVLLTGPLNMLEGNPVDTEVSIGPAA